MKIKLNGSNSATKGFRPFSKLIFLFGVKRDFFFNFFSSSRLKFIQAEISSNKIVRKLKLFVQYCKKKLKTRQTEEVLNDWVVLKISRQDVSKTDQTYPSCYGCISLSLQASATSRPPPRCFARFRKRSSQNFILKLNANAGKKTDKFKKTKKQTWLLNDTV